ncbi:MAG: TonB-dependent receptor [Verrucomicrobia bacterium]|nr:TonB-dependent receptor [Verrucomicrobiota bacterium]
MKLKYAALSVRALPLTTSPTNRSLPKHGMSRSLFSGRKVFLFHAIAFLLSARFLLAASPEADNANAGTTNAASRVPGARVADATQPDKVRLSKITVTATRTERAVEDTPASVSVYDETDLQFKSANGFRDLFRYEPGVEVPASPSGASSISPRYNSGARSVNIRGIEGNRVRMDLDGIRQPDQFTFGSVYNIGRDYIEFEHVKRVEILKGSASTLYGSDAIGGVVAYSTSEPDDLLTLTPNLYSSSYKQGFDSANLGLYESAKFAFETTKDDASKHPKAQALVAYTRRDFQERQNKGDFPANPEQHASNAAIGKVSFLPNLWNKIIATAEYLLRESTTDVKTLRDVRVGPVTTRMSIFEQDVERWRVSLRHEFHDDGGDLWFNDLQWQLYHQPSSTSDLSREAVSTATQNRTRRRIGDYDDIVTGGALQLMTEVNHFDGQKHRLTYGFEGAGAAVSRDKDYLQFTTTTGVATAVDVTGALNPLKEIPDTDVLRFGSFLQDELEFADAGITLIGGLRYDFYDLVANNSARYMNSTRGVPPTGFRDQGFTPRLGGIGKINERLRLYGQYSQGFRNPTSEDLNGAILNTGVAGPPYRTVPNPDLRSEHSHNFEWGARGDYEPVRFSQALYYNRYESFIVPFANAGTGGGFRLFQSKNLTEAEIMGIESKIELPLEYYQPALENLSLIFTFAAAKGNDMDSHQPLPTVQPFKFVSTFRYAANPWNVDLNITHVEQPNRIPDNGPFSVTGGGPAAEQFIPPAFTTVDLVGGWDITPWCKWTVGLYNLTDENYWLWSTVRGIEGTRFDINRYTEPGFNVKTAVTIRF